MTLCMAPREWKGVLGPCGKCIACVKRWSYIWRQRIALEAMCNERTWLLTLTFKEVDGKSYEHVKKYLKLVRKHNDGEKIRYCAVEEKGTKNGRLHYHIAVHCSYSVKRRMLEERWKHGYSNCRLVYCVHTKKNGRVISAARYVAKYITKEKCRIRASKSYGKTIIDDEFRNIVGSVMQVFPGSKIGIRESHQSINVPRVLLKQAGLFISEETAMITAMTDKDWEKIDFDYRSALAEAHRSGTLEQKYNEYLSMLPPDQYVEARDHGKDQPASNEGAVAPVKDEGGVS